MICYDTNDARIYFFMYIVSRDIIHLKTAFKRHADLTYTLCMEHCFIQEYESIVKNKTDNTIEYNDLKLVA